MSMVWISVIAGVVGVGFVGYLAATVLRHDPGTARIREIVAAIEEGSRAFLKREYMTLAVFVAVVAVVLAGGGGDADQLRVGRGASGVGHRAGCVCCGAPVDGDCAAGES